MGFEVTLEHVSKIYATDGASIRALDDITLGVAADQMVAVAGPSGSGKSTLLHVIGAMDDPDGGMIRVGEREVTALSRSAQVEHRRSIGFVFQRFHLLPALTVESNVVAPVLPYHTPFDKHGRASELLRAVGLEGRERSLPSRLSGGEQQRVAIARALINSPGLLLADEPTGNLDSATGEEIMDLIVELRRARGMTVIVATHDPVVAARCERIVRLVDGKVVADESVPVVGADDLLGRITQFGP
jgi:putative ABC transport system ATP-binding protein